MANASIKKHYLANIALPSIYAEALSYYEILEKLCFEVDDLINASPDALDAEIERIKEKLTSLETEIDSTLKILQDEVNAALEEVSSIDVAQMQSDIRDLQSKYTVLSQKIDTEISNLENRTNLAITESSDALKLQISNLNTSLTNQLIQLSDSTNAQISALKSDFESFKDSVQSTVSNIQINEIYFGKNLAVEFASEIANESSIFSWFQKRASLNNFDGIHVCDYIPVSFKVYDNNLSQLNYTEVTANAYILGINNYIGFDGSTNYTNADFILNYKYYFPYFSDFVSGLTNYNNIRGSSFPYFVSGQYASLNSLFNKDYVVRLNNTDTPSWQKTNNPFYNCPQYMFPQSLTFSARNKYIMLPQRANTPNLVVNTSSANFENIGKFWLLSEFEIFGTPLLSNSIFDYNGHFKYPLFNNSSFVNKIFGNAYILSASPCEGVNSWSTFNSTTYVSAIPSPSSGSHYGYICFRL